MYATKTVSSQTTSSWIPMDDNQAAFNASIGVTVSGSLTYSVEFTLDNVQDPAVTPSVFSTTLTGATTSQSLAVHYPVKAFRLNVTAFTSGSATLAVLQGSSWDGAATVGANLVEELEAVYRPAVFPNFAPRLLASLVSSSTASCTSEVVTVTAAAHGITATIYDGVMFYYPGSPSLAAGWYSNFARTGTDTLTFSAPGIANFTSESVNSGAAFTTEVTFQEITLPPNTLEVGSCLNVRLFRASNNVAGTKTTRFKINAVNATTLTNSSTTSIVMSSDFSIIVTSPTASYSHGNQVATGTTTATRQLIDITTAMVVAVSGQLDTAGMFLFMIVPKLSIL